VTERELFVTVGGRKMLGLSLFVAVRNCGDEVLLGDVFTTTGPAKSMPVSLRVESINVYTKLVNVLSAGHTAELELRGVGAELVVAPSDLRGRSNSNRRNFAVLGEAKFKVETLG
jgi:hypothetical protein